MRESTVQPQAAGARVLLVDNFSSFTFNLYQYLAEVTGLPPVVVTGDHREVISLENFDLVVLSPGPGTPTRASDFGICTAMLAQNELPVLGVCLGHQGLGVEAGAELLQARELFHGRASQIVHEGDPLFEGIPRQFGAIRYHSLILQDPLPASIACIARSDHGEIMAIRHTERPQWGVQFHPESAQSEYGHRLLANFCGMALQRRTANRAASVASSPTTDANTFPKASATKKWRLVTHRLDASFDADQLYATLYGSSTQAFWLDGGATGGHSYMGACEGRHSYTIRYQQPEQVAHFQGARNESLPCQSIFALLQQQLEAGGVEADEDYEFTFRGGFVGYFGYELRGDLGSPVSHPSDLPDAQWMWAERFVAFDHANGRATLCALVPIGESDDEAQGWMQEVSLSLQSPVAPSQLSVQGAEIETKARDTAAEYQAKISRAKEKIAQGESYELCLTTQLSADVAIDPNALFRVMRRDNPAPYSALLRCGDFSIVSASPERFLKIDSAGWAESKPIKGTAPRSLDPNLDRKLGEALRESVKERAENLMIVDLVRNDLGKNCEIGSVIVKELAAVESFATVHQLVSTVGGQLRAGVASLQCVSDCFPGGSMTGAPKLRSMEILDRLEAAPRGPYAGALGFLGCDGAVDLSIVIRSVIVQEKAVSIGVGGAITALSEPLAELEEMQLKGLAQRVALGVARAAD